MIALLPLASIVLAIAAIPVPGTALLPQRPVASKPPDPAQRLLAGRVAAAGPFDRVVVDYGKDGAVWAAANNWKASFTASATSFLPFLGSDADRNHPLALRLCAVTVGGEPMAFDAAASPIAAADGAEILYDRDSLTEVYELHLEGIEQKFLFPALPSRGELRLSLHVTTGLAGRLDDDGTVAFTNERGGVRYGRAEAFDAGDRRCQVATRWTNGHVELSVPAEFVATAQMPICIDPLVSTIRVVSPDTNVLRSADIAFDGTLDQYALVWERQYSAIDSDCYVQLLDGAMNPVGSLLVIDLSTVSWLGCKIAGLNAYDKFLVVAQCRSGSLPDWVAGRILTSGSWIAVGNQFDIARDGLPGHPSHVNTIPDVGGDPETVQPTYFTVVWENRDTGFILHRNSILVRQITDQGALRAWSQLDTFDPNANHNCSTPSISKSDGMRPFASQRWGVVWHRDDLSGSHHELRSALIRWDGQVSHFGNPAQPSFWICDQPASGHSSCISSPTDEVLGRRRYVCVTERAGPGGNYDIYGQAFDDTGLRLDIERNLTLLEAGFHHSRDQSSPSVDCDGTRFAVCYREQFVPMSFDFDVCVSTFSFDNSMGGPQWLAHDSHDVAAASVDEEGGAKVVAMRSGGRNGVRYGLAWLHAAGASSPVHQVEARTYDGMQAGSTFVTRATGCGPLQIATVGVPALGQRVQFSLTSAAGSLSGFLCGIPVAWSVTACPGCTQGSYGQAWLGTDLQVTVPRDPGFVGVTVAVQGFDFAAGPCLGQLTISDTIDLTIR